MAEAAADRDVDVRDADVKARKERERDELYALDISDVEWQSAPGTQEHEERVEIAYLPAGAVAMRSSLDPDTVLRYTEAEWRAFVLGARDGEFDLEAGAAQRRARGGVVRAAGADGGTGRRNGSGTEGGRSPGGPTALLLSPPRRVAGQPVIERAVP